MRAVARARALSWVRSVRGALRRPDAPAPRAVPASALRLRSWGGGGSWPRCIRRSVATGIPAPPPRGRSRNDGLYQAAPAASAPDRAGITGSQVQQSPPAPECAGRPCSSGHLTGIWSCQPRAPVASRRGRTYLQLESAAPLARARLQLKCGPLGICDYLCMPDSVTRRNAFSSAVGWVVLTGAVAIPAVLTAQTNVVRPLIVRTDTWPKDTLGIRRETGKITILVRNLHNPAYAVPYPQVWLAGSKDAPHPARRDIAMGDSLGRVVIDSGPQGKPFLWVRALAFHSVSVPIEVVAGCESIVEVYLLANPFCLDGTCPEGTPRATVTVCGGPDA